MNLVEEYLKENETVCGELTSSNGEDTLLITKSVSKDRYNKFNLYLKRKGEKIDRIEVLLFLSPFYKEKEIDTELLEVDGVEGMYLLHIRNCGVINILHDVENDVGVWRLNASSLLMGAEINLLHSSSVPLRNPGFNPLSTINPIYTPGHNPGFNPGPFGNPGFNPGSYGNPGFNPGSYGNPGPFGNPGFNPGPGPQTYSRNREEEKS
jgi:hypothetical protein